MTAARAKCSSDPGSRVTANPGDDQPSAACKHVTQDAHVIGLVVRGEWSVHSSGSGEKIQFLLFACFLCFMYMKKKKR